MAAGIAFAATSQFSEKSEKSAQLSTQVRGTKENPHQIELAKANGDPIDLLIKTGEYVQFNSKDEGEHQIIQGASTMSDHAPSEHVPSPLDSGVIKADEGFLLQFKTRGKYEFHDNYDHDYTITIITYDSNKKIDAEETR